MQICKTMASGRLFWFIIGRIDNNLFSLLICIGQVNAQYILYLDNIQIQIIGVFSYFIMFT